jgi:type I restriction enzyme S subunit
MSGALEARDALRAISVPKDELCSITTGFAGGIFNGPQFSRQWVEEPEFGVPFLSNSDMGSADLSTLPLLKRRYAESRALRHLRLDEGTTLITCSGTIGRMTYVRPDMVGMWSSQHIMKVVPDRKKVAAGFLYAFLSGKYGVPLVVAGTYGAIIQHIEPEHIASLPVPRFGNRLEGEAHRLIEGSSAKRTAASRLMCEAIAELERVGRFSPLQPTRSRMPFSITSAMASSVQPRLDALFHGTYHSEAIESLRTGERKVCPLREVVQSVEEPNRFKRIVLDAESLGVPLFGTSAIFWNDPEPSYYLPKKLAMPYIVTRKTLLMPRSGQLSGVIGRVVLPYGDIVGGAVSEDAIRVHCQSENDAGFLFVFLSSEHGVRQLKARTFGSSIPHLDVRQVGCCLVPERSDDLWTKIGEMGLEVSRLRGEAIDLERRARALVEKAISGEKD